MSLYGLNVIILNIALGLAKGSEVGVFSGAMAALKGKPERSGGVMLLSSVVVLIATMSWYGGEAPAPKAATSSDLTKLFVATEGPLELDGTEPVLGAPSAPYLVVEFADFECPACAATFEPLHALVKASPDVQLRFKHYPLSGLCNEGIEGDRHQYSCAAAVAADCAGEQGKFWPVARQFFMNQRHLGGDGIDIMAGQEHIEAGPFQACRSRVGADLGIQSDIAAARTVGVHATPSLYLKGIRGEEWVLVRGGTPGLEALLDAHRQGMEIPPTPIAEPHSH